MVLGILSSSIAGAKNVPTFYQADQIGKARALVKILPLAKSTYALQIETPSQPFIADKLHHAPQELQKVPVEVSMGPSNLQ